MIPEVQDDLQEDFEEEIQSTKTYYLDMDKKIITNFCDGVTAMKQAIYKILNTERFDCLIYSWDYGIETKELFGENYTYVIPELQRLITEALTQDDRIEDVTDFEFTKLKGQLLVKFNVQTNIGEVEAEKVVSI